MEMLTHTKSSRTKNTILCEVQQVISQPWYFFLSVLAPGMDPNALLTRECIASGRNYLANATYAECMQPFPVYIKGGVERCPLLDDIEG